MYCTTPKQGQLARHTGAITEFRPCWVWGSVGAKMYRGSSASAAGRGQSWLRLFGRRLRLQPAGGGEWFKALRWRLQSSGGRARVGPVGEGSAPW